MRIRTVLTLTRALAGYLRSMPPEHATSVLSAVSAELSGLGIGVELPPGDSSAKPCSARILLPADQPPSTPAQECEAALDPHGDSQSQTEEAPAEWRSLPSVLRCNECGEFLQSRLAVEGHMDRFPGHYQFTSVH